MFGEHLSRGGREGWGGGATPGYNTIQSLSILLSVYSLYQELEICT